MLETYVLQKESAEIHAPLCALN